VQTLPRRGATHRPPDELTNAEGKQLIDQIADMGVPIFVFTGGDPLKRKDVFELIHYAAGKGCRLPLRPAPRRF